MQQLKHLVTTLDCDIRFLGALPDQEIRDIYGAADFFCLTRVPESGPAGSKDSGCGLPRSRGRQPAHSVATLDWQRRFRTHVVQPRDRAVGATLGQGYRPRHRAACRGRRHAIRSRHRRFGACPRDVVATLRRRHLHRLSRPANRATETVPNDVPTAAPPRRTPHRMSTRLENHMRRLALSSRSFSRSPQATPRAKCGQPGAAERYLLGSLGGDLTLPPKTYDDLFKVYMATAPRWPMSRTPIS